MNCYEKAEKAINDFFGDTDKTPEETMEGLSGLRDHIETLMDALDADLKRSLLTQPPFHTMTIGPTRGGMG